MKLRMRIVPEKHAPYVFGVMMAAVMIAFVLAADQLVSTLGRTNTRLLAVAVSVAWPLLLLTFVDPADRDSDRGGECPPPSRTTTDRGAPPGGGSRRRSGSHGVESRRRREAIEVPAC